MAAWLLCTKMIAGTCPTGGKRTGGPIAPCDHAYPHRKVDMCYHGACIANDEEKEEYVDCAFVRSDAEEAERLRKALALRILVENRGGEL